MDDLIDGKVGVEDEATCHLNITSDATAFQGRFNGCMEGVVINGNIYDNQLVLAVQSKDNDLGSFCTFSGKVSPDGSIRGTYYTATKSGDFEWSNIGAQEAPKQKQPVASTTPPKAKATDAIFIPKQQGAKGTGGKPAAPKEVVTELGKTTQPAPAPAPVDMDEPLPKANANTVYHTVEDGDSMYQLRKKYNLTTKKYFWLTQKTNDRLDVGEKIRVSE
jgi:LysM repeat protein